MKALLNAQAKNLENFFFVYGVTQKHAVVQFK